MRKNYFFHLPLLITTLSLAVGLINFTTLKDEEQKCADDLPVSELYFAPASVTNSAHTYTKSPLDEPWYKTVHRYRNTSDPDNKYYDFSQGGTTYGRMNVTSTWQSYRGEGVRVAVIDTGCHQAHEDFSGSNFVLGKNMVSGSTGSAAYDDTNGHGTSSAATIAAAVNSVGGSGIAPNVEVVVLKCVDSSGNFSNSAILNALQYCIDNDVDIINMSIQGYSTTFNTSYIEDFGEVEVNTTSTGIMSSTYLKTKINDCYNEGITIVAAAGNFNTNRESYPAANDHVIAVASTGLLESNKLNKAGFSNYGSWIDICAPGYITTPTLTDNSSYSITYGTSFSAPLVTGAIALYKSKYPNATPDQIEEALKSSATPVSWQGGAGAIDVDAFLATSPDLVHVQSVTLSEHEKTIRVGETYQLQPTVLPIDADDKSVSYVSSDNSIASVDPNGLVRALKKGNVTIQVSSNDLPEIFDTVAITIEASQDTPVETTVNLTNGTSIGSGDSLYIEWTVDNVIKIKQEKGTGNDVNSSYISAPRWYQGHLITFTPLDNKTIVGLTITCTSDAYATELKKSIWSTGTATVSSSTVTWTGETNDAFTVTMGKQSRISSIKVIYKGSAAPTKTLSSIAVTSSTHRTFTIGDSFVKETITATYSDTTTANVTNYATFSGYNMSASGNQTVNVSYTEENVTKETSYQITVNSSPVIINYTVSFNNNGGSGTMANQTTTGSTYVCPECTFTKTNYVFDKWAYGSSSGTKYAKGETITGISVNFTLYATWKQQGGGQDIPEGYYKDITDSMSGTTLLTNLRTLNLNKRTSTVGYSNMGTSPSGQFKYTDYDPATVQYDSKGQPYGTKILSFYSGKSCTSFNREHVWPNSRGGGDGGTAGSPYPDADIFMPRPTITEENSNRGNSKYVEGMVDSSSGWDPVAAFEKTLGVYQGIRGECARIIFYCMTVNSNLVLDDTATSGTKGVTMGKLSDLLKWNLENPVNDREVRRQSGGMYLQGNRNAFVDDPGYACRIWGSYNSETQKICSQSTKKLTNLSYTGTPSKTQYSDGETFDSNGLTVTATYDDETSSNVTSNVTWTPSPLTKGTTSVTGSYTAGGVTRTITVNGITVKDSGGTGGSVTITRDSFSSSASQYNWHTWSNSNVTGEAYIFATEKTKMQFNGGKVGKAIFSDSTLGNIESITVKENGADGKWTLYGSNSAYSTTTTNSGTSLGQKTVTSSGVTWNVSGNYKYFSLYLNDSNARYLDSVTVKYKASGPKVNSISIPDTLSVDKYTEITKTITPTIDADDGAQYTVNWTSSDTSVATVASSGNNGIVTPLKVGTTTITVTAGDVSDTCLLTVTDSTPKVNSITLDKSSASLDLNGTKTVTLTPTVSADIEADTTVYWSSNDTSIATVSKTSGTKLESITVTAKGVGSAIITANCGDKSVSCTITVTDSTPIPVTGVSLNKTSTSLTVGSNEVLIATISPVNATDKSVTWSSNSTNVSVNQEGKITANSVGSATITVTTHDGGFTATCNVTVTAAPAIEYRLEAQETVPFANGTNKIDSITVNLYQYVNGVKGTLVTTGKCDVDTSSLGYKELSLTYNSIKYTTQIKVTNVGAQGNVGTGGGVVTKVDSLTRSSTGVAEGSTTYAEWSNVSCNSDAKYAGQSAGGNNSIQLRSSNNNSGIIQTNSGGKVTKVSVEWNSSTASGRTLQVYGKNSAYSEASDLYKSTSQGTLLGTIVYGTSTELVISGDYTYVGVKSSSGAMYLSSISFTCETSGGPTYKATPFEQAKSWAQYFIDETRTADTCLADTDEAKLAGLKSKWNDLSSEYSAMIGDSKDTFCSDSDIVISQARLHYQYIISKFNRSSQQLTPFVTNGNNDPLSTSSSSFGLTSVTDVSTLVVAITGFVNVATLSTFICIKKKRMSK